MNPYYKYSDHTGDGHQRDTVSRNLIPVFSATGETQRYDMKHNFTWNLLEGRVGCWNTLEWVYSRNGVEYHVPDHEWRVTDCTCLT